MTHAQRINPRALFAGAPYDYAAVAPPGRLVFTAGACPLDVEGAVVAPGDVEEQAAQALDNLATALAAADSSLEDVLKLTVYVATSDRSELVRAWSIVEQRLRPSPPPSTLLGVSVLGYPDQLVEIEAIATASE
jgi:enamine deaminase RidA (YjgF/YER057c/UK114 family)